MCSASSFAPRQQLGDISVEEFLRDYWQKKPLFIPQAFPNFTSQIDADELAGFALDDDVTSRLVIENPDNGRWQVTHGPLPLSAFESLPPSHWSLLIQHADALDPQVNDLLNAFRFIPSWRLDDIMISYASDQGGVGPHFDYFDVFLLQAQGKRRWRIGPQYDSNSALVADSPMKVLQHFNTEHEYIVEPGDLLYIPPQFGHWGQAQGESITYSIGFRAPSHADILLEYSQELAANTGEDMRYQDIDLRAQKDAGEISEHAVERFQKILLSSLNNPTRLAQWIGEYSTELKQPVDELIEAVDEVDLRNNKTVKLNPFNRSAFYQGPQDDPDHTVQCFINGNTWNCSSRLAKALTNYDDIRYDTFCKSDQETLRLLVEQDLLSAVELDPYGE